jgi:ATP-dependent Clp protease ATP-binding subunit ClpX
MKLIVADTKEEEKHCSFCGKSQSEVKKMVGTTTVLICNECVDFANDFMHDRIGQSK